MSALSFQDQTQTITGYNNWKIHFGEVEEMVNRGLREEKVEGSHFLS
jgi:hypothetical protein